MEIVPGIHRIDHVRGANAYLVTSAEGAAIIDTGMPGNAEAILRYVKMVGVDLGSLQYIILTHSDIDHSGSAAELRNLTGAKVAIHEADAPRLSGEKKLKEVKGAMGVIFGFMGPLMRFTPLNPDLRLHDSDRLVNLRVIHTPGHTEGSICLYKEGEAIFVGDAMRTDSRGRPHLPSGAMTLDMAKATESVKKISEQEYSVLLPGHGPPMLRDASKAVAEYVQSGFTEK